MGRAAERATVDSVTVRAFRIPTERPEADGTLEWDATPLCVVDVEGGGRRGFGYGYIAPAAAPLIREVLGPAVRGRDAMAVAGAWETMRRAVRNIGLPGLAASAVGVVDIALWDLKGKLLDASVTDLMGTRRDACPVYGSGGFTSYSVQELERELVGWVEEGIQRVKMKVGRDPAADPDRVAAARTAIGPAPRLFVDANGALTPADALAVAERFAEQDVSWFEEPVSSDTLAGLRRVREGAPAGMRIAAGEYGWDARYFRRMAEAEATDVLQPDVIRCGGYTGFLRVAEVCDAFSIPVSAHTAPQLSAHVCCAAPRVAHLEWFHDHVRIANLLIDGALHPVEGVLRPDRSRAGIGLALKESDADPYRVE